MTSCLGFARCHLGAPSRRRKIVGSRTSHGVKGKVTSSILSAEGPLGKVAQRTALSPHLLGWSSFVVYARRSSNLAAHVKNLPQGRMSVKPPSTAPAIVPTSTTPWTLEQRDQAMWRGPNKSSHGERDFVFTEMLDSLPRILGSPPVHQCPRLAKPPFVTAVGCASV